MYWSRHQLLHQLLHHLLHQLRFRLDVTARLLSAHDRLNPGPKTTVLAWLAVPRLWSLVLPVITVALLAAGCASDGKELAAPKPGQTTTTRPLPPTSAPDQEPSASGLALTSPAFEPGAEIPLSATCAGENVFPELNWGEVDPLAVELAVSLADQTNPEVPVLMWLLAGIPPELTGLQAGQIPVGAYETTDDYGIVGYGEPCLDTYDTGQRDLQWRIYVLGQPSGLAPGHPGNEAWAKVRREAIDTASLLSRRFNE